VSGTVLTPGSPFCSLLVAWPAGRRLTGEARVATTQSEPIDILTGIATNRSIHRFLPDPIPDEDLNEILYAATRGPSGNNAQPFRFLVIRSGPKAERAKALLGDSFRKAWAAKSSAEGWTRGSGADSNSRKARSTRAMLQFVENFERTPVVVLACLVRHRPGAVTEGASIYPGCQNLLLAARALGYGGSITMFHNEAEAALRDLLGIPDDVSILCTIPLGKPAGRHGPLRRRPMRDLVYDDGWGSEAGWATDPPGSRFSRPR
jgi:nitroreductase